MFLNIFTGRHRDTFVANGRVEVRRGSHRAYTYRELVALLTASGFAVNVAQPWSREAHMVSFIATAVYWVAARDSRCGIRDPGCGIRGIDPFRNRLANERASEENC